MCVFSIIEEWDSYATGKFCRLMVIEVSILVMFQLKKKKGGGGGDTLFDISCNISFPLWILFFPYGLIAQLDLVYLISRNCSKDGNCIVISKEISIKLFSFIYVSQ